MKSAAIALLALAIMAPTTISVGAINPLLNYQGYLTDDLGYPYPDGIHNITFSIYDQDSGGTPLWTETQAVTLKSGLLHAYLGTSTPLSEVLFETQPLYVGIKYESDPEFTPRILLASSVSSFLAANSDKLGGYPAEHFVDGDNLDAAIGDHAADASAHHTKTTDASELTSGKLDPERLPDLEIESEDIVDGTVATADLADSLVTSEKIAAGAVTNEHLSMSAITGENIADGSLTAADLADSTITGDKIAQGAISSEHLSGSPLTGANIADGSLTGADIQDGTVYGIDIAYDDVSSYNIKDGTITGDDIATGTISGIKIIDGSIGNADLGYNSVSTAQLVDNSVRSIDVHDGSLEAVDILDEPGVDVGYGFVITNVDTTVHSWVTATISAPASGYILAIFSCFTQISSGEIAQAGVSLAADDIGAYSEAKIVSTAIGTGANLSIMTADVFAVSAGDVVVHGNVRAAISSTGNVDFREGKLQVIYIPTGY